MNYCQCAQCGCKLSESDAHYRIVVEIIENSDSAPLNLQDEISEQMNRLLYQLEEFHPEKSEGEGYEEIVFILCRECKDFFLRDPLGSKKRFVALKTGSSHLLH